MPSSFTTKRSAFVVVASSPVRFEVNASSLPSGEKAKSAAPPTEKMGESKSPGVASRHVSFAASRSPTRMCVRVPSFQSVQWR